MKLHKEGYLSIVIATVVTAVVLFLYFHFTDFSFICNLIVVILLLIPLGLTIRFFRIPNRYANIVGDGIISPADGLVIDIEETEEHEYFHDQRIKISIFMSIHNVHVNFYPIDGEIEYVAYHPGKYFIAHLPKSSLDNEHNTVVVKNDNVHVLFRQIAGFIARRIVSYPQVGDKVKQCDEMGMIRFGSRVDVFLPLDAKINVHLGEKVRAKKSVLAYV